MSLNFSGGGYLVQPYLEKIITSIKFSECILNDFLKFYIFFVLGVYCGKMIFEWVEKNRKTLVPILGLLLIVGNIIIFLNDNLDNSIISFILALIGSFFVVGISLMIKKSRALAYLGRKSLPIYVLQGFAIAATRIILTRMNLNDTIGIIPIFACTVMGTLIPIVAYWLSTKIWKFEFCFYPGKFIKA